MGRPTKYKPEFNDLVTKFCMLGATNKNLAKFLEVSVQTISYWLAHDQQFLEAIKEGREFADANVAKAMYHKAIGYKHKEVHVSNYKGEITLTEIEKNYPPDTAAAFIWLKNRNPELWKQQPEVIHHEHTVKELQVVKASDYKGMEVSKKSA